MEFDEKWTKSVGIGWKEHPVLQGQTSKMNHLNKPWQPEGGAGPLSRALMRENRWECHIRDARHATSGPEGGRAQHGHSRVHIAPPGTDARMPEQMVDRVVD